MIPPHLGTPPPEDATAVQGEAREARKKGGRLASHQGAGAAQDVPVAAEVVPADCKPVRGAMRGDAAGRVGPDL